MPFAANECRTLPEQYALGGVVQVTLAHGSGLQAPFAQPKGHPVSFEGYVHPPPLHVPDGEYVRRLPLTHTAGGGALQVTPAHGSP